MDENTLLREVTKRVVERTGIAALWEPGTVVREVMRFEHSDRTVSLGIMQGQFVIESGQGVEVVFDGQKTADAPGAIRDAADEVIRRLGVPVFD